MTALVELRLHLEGAAPPGFVRGLAAEKRVDLSGLFREDGGYRLDGPSSVLRAREAASSVITTPGDHARLTRAVLEAAASHGAVYVEAFLSPDLAAGSDPARWREVVAAVEEAARAVPEVAMRAVPTCMRHLGPDRARAAALCAAETAGGFVTGWGLGGDETVGAPADYAWAFDCAREAGLGITVEAGERRGPESVRAALDALRPSRIGHGVRAIEDPALVDRLAEAGAVLEICPGANVALGLYPRIDAHPIERLRERGVAVTVSTGDPAFLGTDLTGEYEALAGAFGWDDAVMAEVNRTAARAAFCDEATRAGLLARIG